MTNGLNTKIEVEPKLLAQPNSKSFDSNFILYIQIINLATEKSVKTITFNCRNIPPLLNPFYSSSYVYSTIYKISK